MDGRVSAEVVNGRPGRSGRARSDNGSWQAEKSHLMCMHILDATMQCLIDIGYTQTTTEKIARQAGVSRGAMTHHFKSRAEVFAAAAAHITDVRVREYDEAIKAVTLRGGQEPTLENMRHTLEALQQYYMKPSFLAYQELLRGARTDPELRAVMEPLEQSLDERVAASMISQFPVWAEPGMREVGEVLRDLMMHSLQGVALDPAQYLKGDRLQRLHELLAKTAMNEYREACERRNKTRG